jgi:hypothetical protein
MTATPISQIPSLSELGNVPETYWHEWRVATPLEPIVVSGGVFKWYHVHRDGVAVRDDIDVKARRVIADGAQRWPLQYGLNFALLHQSTAGAYLIVGVWRGHNEWWRAIYAIGLDDCEEFSRVEEADGLAPGSCVWELGVVCHERMAWHRYLFSARDDASKLAWLDDTFAGSV